MRPVLKKRPTQYNNDPTTRTIDFLTSNIATEVNTLFKTFSPTAKDLIDNLEEYNFGKINDDISDLEEKKETEEANLKRLQNKKQKLKQQKAIQNNKAEIKKVKNEIKDIEEELEPLVKKIKTFKKIKNTIVEKLTEIYQQSKVDLEDNIGRYCSYCEIISNDLAVEHIVPKAPYPLKMIEWDNFLLGCKGCNSTKGDRPERKQAKQWVASNANANDMAQAILNHHYWPHIDESSFRLYKYTLMYKDGNDFKPIDLNRSAHLENFSDINPRSSGVIASVRIDNTTWKRNVEVVSVANPIGAVSGFTLDKPRLESTLGLLKLDKVTNTKGKRDKRTVRRAESWFEILREVDDLDKEVLKAGADTNQQKEKFVSQWENLLKIAKKTGFYSVWVTILQEHNYPAFLDNPNKYKKLGQKFVADTNDGQIDIRKNFPGTRTTNLLP